MEREMLFTCLDARYHSCHVWSDQETGWRRHKKQLKIGK